MKYIYKVECDGDSLYILAESQESARQRLHAICGRVPEYLVKWTIVTALPKGEEFL
jgi:hypothetical protein